MHVRRTLIDGMHIPGSCSHPSSPQVPGRQRPPDALRCYACVQVSWDRRLHLLLFFSSEHTMGTPTLVNFMRAVKFARVGSSKQSGVTKTTKVTG